MLWVENNDFIKVKRQSENAFSGLQLRHSLNGLLFNQILMSDLNESSVIGSLSVLIYTYPLVLLQKFRKGWNSGASAGLQVTFVLSVYMQ